MGRTIRLKIARRSDGARVATVTIEHQSPRLTFVRIRPYRRRRVFELSLEAATGGLLVGVVKRQNARHRLVHRNRSER
jgi:hypothetical protein